ncbi:MAG: flagellar protein FliT [Lachnospiraceae bacterium]|nr:flagellar protein FliT [Lachnospiraceae bacterium]
MKNSLDVLSESLDMKIQVLKDIQKYNEDQREAFELDDPDMDSFDGAIEEKDVLIERLIKLDEGFESLYSEISEELNNNKEKYSDKIKLIQDKISEITELSATVQAQEARNKKLIEAYFAKQRNGIKKNRVSSKAAYDYYRNMSGMNLPPVSIMDSKH